MQTELARLLSSGELLCTSSVTWSSGTLPLRVAYYCSRTDPPAEFISSVRGIIFWDDSVLVITGPNSDYYILPGGRVEKDETPLQTLQREMLEETGWTFTNPEMVGFMHFHHYGIRPPDYRYPFPDFIWPVYTGEAGNFMPDVRVPDKWVLESAFLPIQQVKKLSLDQGQLMLLDVALTMRKTAG